MWKETVLDAESARRRRGDHIIILEKYVPWEDLMVWLGRDAYYIVYPASFGGWLLKCIPPSARCPGQRVPLPAAWGGLRNEELQEVSGVSGVDFCHPGRYIARAASKDAAIKFAEEAYKQQTLDERRLHALKLAATIKNVEAVRWLHALFAG